MCPYSNRSILKTIFVFFLDWIFTGIFTLMTDPIGLKYHHYFPEILCDALMDTGLIDDLETDIWTVFAPTNDAFEELGSNTLDTLSNDTAVLTDLLLFHTVAGTALKSDDLPCVAGENLITMANGIETRT
jgi:hypothetical protein